MPEPAQSVYFISGPSGEMLEEVTRLIRSRPLHVIVLLPSIDVIAAREGARADPGYDHWSIEDLYAAFAERTPRIGLWLDNSDQAPEETVDEILDATRSA